MTSSWSGCSGHKDPEATVPWLAGGWSSTGSDIGAWSPACDIKRWWDLVEVTKPLGSSPSEGMNVLLGPWLVPKSGGYKKQPSPARLSLSCTSSYLNVIAMLWRSQGLKNQSGHHAVWTLEWSLAKASPGAEPSAHLPVTFLTHSSLIWSVLKYRLWICWPSLDMCAPSLSPQLPSAASCLLKTANLSAHQIPGRWRLRLGPLASGLTCWPVALLSHPGLHSLCPHCPLVSPQHGEHWPRRSTQQL